MPYTPKPGDTLFIDGAEYRIAEHPAAPGMPYGQEGRQAVVYQLVVQGGEKRAIKVFKPRYQIPSLATLSRRLAPYAELPGMRVCRRTCLTPQQNKELLRQYRHLTYSVVMPWIEGPTWTEVMLKKQRLTPQHSLKLALELTELLANMEQEGLAHCDLSGANLLLYTVLPGENDLADHSTSGVELVDVEQMYGPELRRPDLLPGGSPGYAHKTAAEGLWLANADRFAGAILIAETLAWCDEQIRGAAWGESYFEPIDLHQNCDRLRVMLGALRNRWGEDVADLLVRAWQSESLGECPTFGTWLVTLPETVPKPTSGPKSYASSAPALFTEWFPPLSESQPTTHPAIPVPEQRARVSGEGRVTSEETIWPPIRERVAGNDTRDDYIESLSSAALSAYQREEWARARELLTDVVARDPGYSIRGSRASSLLANAEKHLAAPGRPSRSVGMLAVPLILGLLLVAAGVLAVYQVQTQTTVAARATVTTQAISVLATERAVASRTALAVGDAGKTASAVQSISTAQAGATNQALQVASTSTAEALAATAAATVAATETTASSASETAVAQARDTTVAHVEATAQAIQVATAYIFQQASATAEAQARTIALATQAAKVQKADATSTARARASATTQALRRANAAEETATARTVAVAKPTAPPIQPPPELIPVPQLISPPNGSSLESGASIILRASSVPYSRSLLYVFHVEDTDFASIKEQDFVSLTWNSGTIPYLQIFPSEDLSISRRYLPGRTYRWRVWAFHKTDPSDWDGRNSPRSTNSEWWTFTIKP
jgi:hypothetical protein